MYIQKPSDTNFDPPPAGTHLATCFRVIDLGTQLVEFQGESKKQHKILVSWELPHELMDDGRPFTIGQRYTFSMSEKATLRHHLEAWRGRQFTEADFNGPPDGFHMQKIIGAGCFLNVIHKLKDGKTYANIGAVMAMPKGQKAAPLVNPPVFFSLTEFDPLVFEGLSEGLKKIIQTSPEYQALMHQQNTGDEPQGEGRPPRDLDDEIPF